MKFQDVLDEVGSFGCFQKRLYCVLFLASVPNAFINLMFVFIHYVPPFSCQFPKNLSSSSELFVNHTMLEEGNGCLLISDSSYVKNSLNVNNSNRSCETGWNYHVSDGTLTAVMEFNMICDKAWRAPLVVSLYMVGMAVGSCSGPLSDRYGRRVVFLSSTYLQFIFQGILGFAWNFESYAVLTFIVGLLGLVNYISASVMLSEVVHYEKRNLMLTSKSFGFSLGICILPFIGYFIQNWRWYLWITSLMGILYLPLIWLVPESARWLLARAKRTEAIQVISDIAKVNGKTVNVEALLQGVTTEELLESDKAERCMKKDMKLSHLVLNAGLRFRFMTIYLAWLVCSVTYYAVLLNPAKLSGNRYVNLFLLGLVEFPSYILTYYSIHLIGRPRSLFLYLILAGLFCIAAPFIPADDSTAVVISLLCSKSFISCAFAICYVVVMEISPTLVRNSSTGIASFCARVGGVIMPYLMYAGSDAGRPVPYMIMGGLAFASGLTVIFSIPETKNVPLPETMKEAVQNKRIYGFSLLRKFQKETIHKTEIVAT